MVIVNTRFNGAISTYQIRASIQGGNSEIPNNIYKK